MSDLPYIINAGPIEGHGEVSVEFSVFSDVEVNPDITPDGIAVVLHNAIASLGIGATSITRQVTTSKDISDVPPTAPITETTDAAN